MNANEMKIWKNSRTIYHAIRGCLFSTLFQQFIIPHFVEQFFLFAWRTTKILDGCLFVVHPDGVKEPAAKKIKRKKSMKQYKERIKCNKNVCHIYEYQTLRAGERRQQQSINQTSNDFGLEVQGIEFKLKIARNAHTDDGDDLNTMITVISAAHHAFA